MQTSSRSSSCQLAANLEWRNHLNAGVVLGSEGYGFDQVDGAHNVKTPHLGIVVVEDDVEIGANTSIDRSRFDQSEVGAGTKIDNLVQIGHNVKIGKGLFNRSSSWNFWKCYNG